MCYLLESLTIISSILFKSLEASLSKKEKRKTIPKLVFSLQNQNTFFVALVICLHSTTKQRRQATTIIRKKGNLEVHINPIDHFGARRRLQGRRIFFSLVSLRLLNSTSIGSIIFGHDAGCRGVGTLFFSGRPQTIEEQYWWNKVTFRNIKKPFNILGSKYLPYARHYNPR